jgi:type II secretory pathway component PulJ
LDPATLKLLTDLLNAGALVAVVVLFIAGFLVSRPTLERHILAPRDQRIEALERSMSRRDEDMRQLLEQQANALEAQSRVVDRLLAERDRHEGGGRK